MITNCEHPEKVVVGGYKTSVCKACRASNIRTFYASGPLLPTTKTNGGRPRPARIHFELAEPVIPGSQLGPTTYPEDAQP